jgi:hypothetical protein
MVNSKPIMAAVLIAVLCALAAIIIFTGEKRKIKKQFAHLREWIEKDPKETKLITTLKVQKIQRLFAEKCELESPDAFSGVYTPQEIATYALGALNKCSEFSIKFYDLDIEITGPKEASAVLTAKLSGKLIRGESLDETYELSSLLIKRDKSWLFRRFQIVEVLKK